MTSFFASIFIYFSFFACCHLDAQAASLKPAAAKLVLLNNSCSECLSLSLSLNCNCKVAVVQQEMEDRWMKQVAGIITFSPYCSFHNNSFVLRFWII